MNKNNEINENKFRLRYNSVGQKRHCILKWNLTPMQDISKIKFNISRGLFRGKTESVNRPFTKFFLLNMDL